MFETPPFQNGIRKGASERVYKDPLSKLGYVEEAQAVTVVVVRYEGGKELFAGSEVVLHFFGDVIVVAVDGETRALFHVDDLIDVSVKGEEGEESVEQ